jgi:hypothetical protein
MKFRELVRRAAGLSVVVLACALSIASQPPQGPQVRASEDGEDFAVEAGGDALELLLTVRASDEAIAELIDRGGSTRAGLDARFSIPNSPADDENLNDDAPVLRVEISPEEDPEAVEVREVTFRFDGQRAFPAINPFTTCEAGCEERYVVRVTPPDDLRGREDVTLEWSASVEIEYAFIKADGDLPLMERGVPARDGASVEIEVEAR